MSGQDGEPRAQSGFIWVAVDAIALSAIAAMEQAGVGCALVQSHNRWVGILSDRQVMRAIAQGLDLRQTPVSRVMAPPDIHFPAAKSHDYAAIRQLFAAQSLSYLPLVTATGEVVSVLTSHDLLGHDRLRMDSATLTIESPPSRSRPKRLDQNLAADQIDRKDPTGVKADTTAPTPLNPEPEATQSHALGQSHVLGQSQPRSASPEPISSASLVLHELSRFRQVVDNSPNAILSVNAQGVILTWNPSCTELLGYDAKIRGQSLWVLLKDSSQRVAIATAIQRVFAGDTINDQDIAYRTQDGRICHTLSRLYPLTNSQNEVTACILANTDITARRQIEERLRQREQALLRAQRLAQIGDWSLDIATQELKVSAETCRILGLELGRQSMPFEEALAQIHESDRPLAQSILAQAIRRKSPYSLEVRLPQADGSLRYAFINGQVIVDSQGQAQQLFGILQDMTLRRESENLHRQQARRNQLMLHVTQRIRQSLDLKEILNTTAAEVRQVLQIDRVVIYRFETDWSGVFTVESVVRPSYSIMGQVFDDPCFRSTHVEQYYQGRVSAIHNVALANIAPCHLKTLQDFGIQANLVVPILVGEKLWGLMIAHACTAPRHWQEWEQELLQQLGIQVGIAIQQSELYECVQQLNIDLEHKVQSRTARLERIHSFESLLKRIADRVRDSLDEQQILQKVVQDLTLELQISNCNIGIYDLDRRVSTIQQEFVAAQAGSTCHRVVEMKQFQAVYTQLMRGETLHFCWLPNAYKEVQSIHSIHLPYTVLACPLIDNQGGIGDLWLYRAGHEAFDDLEIRLVQQIASQCAIAIRQARLYEAAQAQVKELAHLNQLKDEFLSSVSHELRTPMANVKMATEMLEVKLLELGLLLNTSQPMVNRYFHILKDECQRELKLINDLLDLSRLDANTEPLFLSTMELPNWLRHLAEPFLARTHSANQTLTFQIPDKLPPLTTDFTYLGRILGELLNNACKYTPKDEDITVTVLSNADHLQIQVTNSGVEIAPAEQERVFERFYRIPSGDPWQHEGTGLGLALVQKLSEQLGGTVTLTSANNRTCFTVHLFPHLLMERFTSITRQIKAQELTTISTDY